MNAHVAIVGDPIIAIFGVFEVCSWPEGAKRLCHPFARARFAVIS